jgi:ABC-type molybdate transport system substrate-binding protein
MRRLAALAVAFAMSTAAHAQDAIAVYAAGSLREAVTGVAALWQARGAARDFAAFLLTAPAQAVFARLGFLEVRP